MCLARANGRLTLAPMLLERSFQAQFLVPMATSLAFGLMMSTVVVLFQIPIFYRLYAGFIAFFGYDPAKVGLEDHDEPSDYRESSDQVSPTPAVV